MFRKKPVKSDTLNRSIAIHIPERASVSEYRYPIIDTRVAQVFEGLTIEFCASKVIKVERIPYSQGFNLFIHPPVTDSQAANFAEKANTVLEEKKAYILRDDRIIDP